MPLNLEQIGEIKQRLESLSMDKALPIEERTRLFLQGLKKIIMPDGGNLYNLLGESESKRLAETALKDTKLFRIGSSIRHYVDTTVVTTYNTIEAQHAGQTQSTDESFMIGNVSPQFVAKDFDGLSSTGQQAMQQAASYPLKSIGGRSFNDLAQIFGTAASQLVKYLENSLKQAQNNTRLIAAVTIGVSLAVASIAIGPTKIALGASAAVAHILPYALKAMKSAAAAIKRSDLTTPVPAILTAATGAAATLSKVRGTGTPTGRHTDRLQGRLKHSRASQERC